MHTTFDTVHGLEHSVPVDPEFLELIAAFVAELPERAFRLELHAGEQEWEPVRRLAHQIKGAAASYGFREISQVAGVLELAVSKQSAGHIRADLVGKLAALCRAAAST